MLVVDILACTILLTSLTGCFSASHTLRSDLLFCFFGALIYSVAQYHQPAAPDHTTGEGIRLQGSKMAFSTLTCIAALWRQDQGRQLRLFVARGCDHCVWSEYEASRHACCCSWESRVGLPHISLASSASWRMRLEVLVVARLSGHGLFTDLPLQPCTPAACTVNSTSGGERQPDHPTLLHRLARSPLVHWSSLTSIGTLIGSW